MPKSREVVVSNGKPAFYACIFDDLKKAALNCGWALGLHGSLASDMDIMAMPWTEDAKPVEEMIQALSDCFTDSPFKEHHTIPHYGKPNNRVVYTISIWGDFYLDINVINPKIAERALEIACTDMACDDCCPYDTVDDFAGKPECDDCPCHREIHQDTARDVNCWVEYYLDQAKVEIEKAGAES